MYSDYLGGRECKQTWRTCLGGQVEQPQHFFFYLHTIYFSVYNLCKQLMQDFPYLSILIIVHFRISSIGLFVNLLTIVNFSFFSDIWIVVYFSSRLVILYYIRRIKPSLFGRLKITFPFLLESVGHYCGHRSWTVYCYSFHKLLFLAFLKIMTLS